MLMPYFKLTLNKRNYIILLILILILSLLVLTVSLFKGDSPKLIVSDGNGYYAWVRSLIIDGDLNFENDFKELYFPDSPPPEINMRTPKGLIPNKYPIGMAIVELPGFLIGHFIAKITPFADDGISLPYQISVIISLVLLIIFSFYLFYLFLIRNNIDSQIAVFFSITSLLATNIIHYIAKEPSMSHGTGLALINILLFLSTLSIYKKNTHITPYFGYGLLMGLLLLVRNTNLVFLPLLFYLIWQNRPKNNQISALLAGIFLMFFLQQLILFYLWGEPILYSYKGESFNGGILGFWSSLWGKTYGLFIYHPWYLILLIIILFGLFYLKHNQSLYFLIIISFAGLWFINSLWGAFGDSFGHRAFIEIITTLSFGAALIVNNLYRNLSQSLSLSILILAIILTFINFYLWGGYLLNKYPHNYERTALQAYTWIIQ